MAHWIAQLLMGALTYSFVGYWLHRLWHRALRHGHRLPGREGERQHHIAWDKPGRHAGNLGAPGGSVAVAILCVSVFIGWPFAFGAMTAFAVDEHVHQRAHLCPHGGMLHRLHRVHHEKHFCNYAFASGLMWDWAFRTLDTGKGSTNA